MKGVSAGGGHPTRAIFAVTNFLLNNWKKFGNRTLTFTAMYAIILLFQKKGVIKMEKYRVEIICMDEANYLSFMGQCSYSYHDVKKNIGLFCGGDPITFKEKVQSKLEEVFPHVQVLVFPLEEADFTYETKIDTPERMLIDYVIKNYFYLMEG